MDLGSILSRDEACGLRNPLRRARGAELWWNRQSLPFLFHTHTVSARSSRHPINEQAPSRPVRGLTEGEGDGDGSAHRQQFQERRKEKQCRVCRSVTSISLNLYDSA
jgi:hypothetical protein